MLHDPEKAPEDAARMIEVLSHKATSWQEREESWLAVFNALSISTGITVSVFTLIASLAMFNTLAMIVLEKTKDIAILRSMGYERRDITQIFLWQAGIVLAIGAVVALDPATNLCTIYDRRPQTCRDFNRGENLCRNILRHYNERSLLPR